MQNLKCFERTALKANIQDGRQKDLIPRAQAYNLLVFFFNVMCDIWFLRVYCMPSAGTISLIAGIFRLLG